MRLPPPRLAHIALALALTALAHAQYGGPPSDYDRQRRLENEGQKFRDLLRTQTNTPTPRSSGGSSTPDWLDQVRAEQSAQRSAAEAARRQRELDAEWKRDHPYETRAEYFTRLEQQRAAADYEASAAGIAAARAANARAVQAEHEALLARMDKTRWENYRAANHNFTPRAFSPSFPTPADALAWYLAHDRESPNPWAASQAAILLIDGYGIPADPAAAARLLDPRTRREPTGEQPRPELAALFAYLRAVHPESCAPLGFPADPASARRDLEALARLPHNNVAHWYLARLLSESPDPADQIKALEFLPEGYAWMLKHPAGLLTTQSEGSYMVSRPVDATAATILTRSTDQLPEALATWPLEKITAIAALALQLPEPKRNAALLHFAEAAAERYLSRSPSPKFPYSEFDYLLFVAGSRGSSAAYAIAYFERLQLIRFDEAGRYKPRFLELDNLARPLPALSRWALRDDALGVRARLALSAIAFEIKARQASAAQPSTPVVLPEPFASVTAAIKRYRAAAYVDTAHYIAPSVTDAAEKARAIQSALQAVKAAIARRDAAAPPISAVAPLLAGLQNFQRSQDQRFQLNQEPPLSASAAPALFAVESPSFDLDRAAGRFDAALDPDPARRLKGTARLHALYEATRLGDAFAPRLLAQDPDFRAILSDVAREQLRALGDARLARDEASRRPRALIARFLEASLRHTVPDPALVTTAAANGSRLAARLLLDQRLQPSLPADPDAPASAQLTPALVDEFDAALLALDAQPPAPAEWQLLTLLTTGDSAERPVGKWFPHVTRWTEDRDERLASAALSKALRPAFEALVITLGEWPGLDHADARHADWLNESDQTYRKAKALIATDGIAALTLCLEAAGRGNRDSLDLLAYNLRRGLGTLPRSPEFADLLMGALLKIAQADAEVGDSHAAHYLGTCLMEGIGIAKNPTAAREWILYSARRGRVDAAAELRLIAERNAQPGDPDAVRHWFTVGQMIDANQYIPIPPRRLSSDVIELTPIRPALEAALATAHANLDALKTKRPASEEPGAAFERYLAATDEAHRAPLTGLVPLAQLASTGNRHAAFATAQFLAGGFSGVRPDAPLARRFHALALALQQIDAEFGDADEAHLLGLHHLELAEKRDPAAAIRWLTYAAELGHAEATICLRTLYTTGAPGIPADPKAVARWTTVGTDAFKPRAPLR